MEVDEDECLFNYAMKGQWRKILEAYKNKAEGLESKITKSEDTVIHIAIYVGQTQFVTTLLDNIKKEDNIRILGMQNSKGNTPLHLAAELGNVEICTSIARLDANLISCRNYDGETPFFLAAHYGKKDAFFSLYAYLNNKQDHSLCRKTNGDTILHSTIFGEYFDLAFQIIHLYPNLAVSINEDGVSPLHVLARKPNCFKSCTGMESFDIFIYKCLIVDELKEIEELRREDKKSIDCPKNYATCMNLVETFKTILKVTTIGTNKGKAGLDEENPSRTYSHKREEAKRREKSYRFPPNWETLIRFSVIMMKFFLIIFGVGASWIRKIQRKKEKHVWAKQVMEELVERQRTSMYRYNHSAGTNPNPNPHLINDDDPLIHQTRTITESPILIAAKTGITEMVNKILDTFPLAMQDVDAYNKNVVLLAIESRQPHVFNLLRNNDFVKDNAFRQIDANGNSAMHLAAACREHTPWRVHGAAMQMQWEYKWYKLVKNSMPPNYFARYNHKGLTAKQLFVQTHAGLVKEGSKWLTKTAESCSVVAALVATVAFTTSTAIPGGSNQDTGVPLLRGRLLFNVYTVASLVALCTSVTALVLFLSILTSRYQEKDFAVGLPRKLLLGMTSLFTSIASVLISFCAGHFFIVEAGLRYAVYPIYAATFLPVSFFALVQLPLYLDLLLAMLRKVPQRSYKVGLSPKEQNKTNKKKTKSSSLQVGNPSDVFKHEDDKIRERVMHQRAGLTSL